MTETVQPPGNYYDKYRTRNPVARWLMTGFLSAFDQLTSQVSPTHVLEVGCGEGELSIRLAKRGIRVAACDLAGAAVAEARKRSEAAGVNLKLWTSGLEQVSTTDAAPLVVCCEVLEHLDDPGAGLDHLATLSAPWLIASVPREPLWRVLNVARGKYLDALGNTPGHVNHWSRRGFVQFIERRFDIVRVMSPLPWTMVLARRRDEAT